MTKDGSINNNGKIYFEINDKYYFELFKYVSDANLSYSFVKDINRKFRFLIINCWIFKFWYLN